MGTAFLRVLAMTFALAAVLFGSEAEASHFRFGTITWTVPNPMTAPRTVRFTITHAWRSDAVNSVTLNFGDGSTVSNTGPQIGTGRDVANTTYAVHQFTVDHTYTTNGPFTVFFSGCCWISGLQGSPSNFRVETTVSLATGNTGGPVTTSPAIISLSSGAVRQYFIPIFDPDLDPATCRFATTGESSLSTPIPTVPTGGARPTLTPVQGGCIMEWDLRMATSGQRYVLPFVGESTHAGVVSRTTLEVIIEISSQPPPVCTGTGTFTAPVGAPFSTRVTGTNPTAADLTMSVINLPTGATLTPVNGTVRAAPFETTFAWTPGMAFFGTTQNVLINYRNPAGLTATCFLTIQVPQCNGFGQACTVGVGTCARTGQTVCTGPGTSACNVTPGAAGTETCDGLDNDCNGTVDNGTLCSGTTPFCDSTTLRRCVQCRTNADCPGSAPVCDAATRVCRPCNADMECSGSTPACATGRACVQCTATNRTACTGSTSLCNVPANACVQCLANSDCSGATPICNLTTHACRACSADADCSGTTPACATSGTNAGRCVQCTSANSTQCSGMTTVCNTAQNRCVNCNSNDDCQGTTPVCESTTRTCRACTADSECAGRPEAPACILTGTTAGSCVQCTATNRSACTGATPVCNVASSRCVQCNTNSECSGDTPICDRNQCRRCSTDADCGGTTPACASSGRCVQCTAANGAACTGATAVCETAMNRCVQCLTDAQCSGRTPVCRSNACTACVADADCTMRTGTLACATAGSNSGACVQCKASNATACMSPTSVCNDATNRCVQCTGNSQCSGNTPVCDANMCRACRADADCAGRTGTEVCGGAGACVQCTAANRAACTGDTPVCNAMTSTCVLCVPGAGGNADRCAMSSDGRACIAGMETTDPAFCGCVTDADCGDRTSGRICNPMTRRCAAGCAVGEGRNGCPMGQSCTADDAAAPGVCTMTCNRDADCMLPNPVCRPAMGAEPRACVECVTDTHCASRTDDRTRCIGDSNTCAQCSPAMASLCADNTNGSACVMGLCGCERDADCGGTSSGRVCDSMTRRCRAGCHPGEGNNLCPMGMSCTSDSSETVGQCTTSCNRNADCSDPRPFCLAGSSGDAGVGSQCVECTMDSQCASRTDGRTRCIEDNHSCAQCSPSNTAGCSRDGAGSACLANGLCGCMGDADCGASLRCDTQANRCVPRPVEVDSGVDAGTPDAGAVTTDLGAPPTDLGMDASAPPNNSFQGGGCACRVGAGTGSPASSPRGAVAALALAFAALAARRRSPRREARSAPPRAA